MLQRWAGFLRRNRLEPVALATAIDRLRAFVLEPWAALAADSEFLKKSSPGGPWLRLSDGDVADGRQSIISYSGVDGGRLGPPRGRGAAVTPGQ